MPERDVMRSLARFTPTPAGFDRDTLLFNAGRASVRRRWWLGPVVVVLVLAQVTTLVVLWPQATPTVMPPATPPSTRLPADPDAPHEPSSVAPNSLAQWTQYIRSDGDLPPFNRSANSTPEQAPLTVSSRNVGD